MKKVMILLAMLIAGNVMMAQERDYQNAFTYNRNGYYEKAMMSIEKCVNHEYFLGQKPIKQSKAWLLRAAIYQNIFQSNDEKLKAKAPDALDIAYQSLAKCMENEEYVKDEQNQMEIGMHLAFVLLTYSSQGAEAFNNGKYAEAAPLFKKAYDIAMAQVGGAQVGGAQASPELDGAVQAAREQANEMLNYAGMAALQAGDYNTALEYFTELKNNGTVTSEVYRRLAMCYNGLGQSEQAMEMINAGLAINPSDANLIVEKVNALLKEGRGSEAIVDLQKLLEIDPENVQMLFALGNIYGNEENKDVYNAEKAKQYYEQALSIKPDYIDATYNLGVLYTSMANSYFRQANEITGFSDAEQAQYKSLMDQYKDLLRQGLPYLQRSYEAQPSDDVKKVLRSIYVQLNMMEEVKALDGGE